MARYKKQKEIETVSEESPVIAFQKEVISEEPEETKVLMDIPEEPVPEESPVIVISETSKNLSFEELYKLNQRTILEAVPRKKKNIKKRNRPGSSIWNPIIIGEK